MPFSDAEFSMEAVGDTDDVYLLTATVPVVGSLTVTISL